MKYRYDSTNSITFEEDANGFLTVHGVVATAGERLIYKDGIETVAESGLFGKADALLGIPVTNDHPRSGLLNPSTAQAHQCGSVTSWRKDGKSLKVSMKVTDANAIRDIKAGKMGISAGYTCKVDGNGNQVERTYNHIAIVQRGRSPSSGIRADSAQPFQGTAQERANAQFFNGWKK